MKIKRKFTVFTVEDNMLYALILKHNLSSKGEFSIIHYTTGEECISNLKLKPDLIILDYHLLGMNGLETLAKIRLVSLELPVVILTHETDDFIKENFYGFGINDLIDKNDDPLTNLIPLINQIHQKTVLI